MRVTLLSDTHNKHYQLNGDMLDVNGDMLDGQLVIHAGDISSMGYSHEIEDFCRWYDQLNYDFKVFIAGNHDWGFQDNSEKINQIVNSFKTIDYLQDNYIKVGNDNNMVKIYGTPWQPEFYNWAFNLPKNGEELAVKWDAIPDDTDILVTHGPPFGTLDTVISRRNDNLGCELLAKRVKIVKPKIHVFGHIHTGYGYVFKDGTHYFNAAVLNEDYRFAQRPFSFDWDPVTNKIDFL